MRILVAMAGYGQLSSGALGRLIAAGWAGERVDVVPVGESGDGFVEAYAELIDAELEQVELDGGGFGLLAGGAVPKGIEAGDIAFGVGTRSVGPGAAQAGRSEVVTGLGRRGVVAAEIATSSRALGAALALALRRRPQRVLLDLAWTGDPLAADAGAGLLAAAGVTADIPLDGGPSALRNLGALDAHAAREALCGIDLVGVVPTAERATVLGGLRGITSRRPRSFDSDPAELLATDAALVALAGQLGVDPHAPGSGACGGVGTAVLALGGRLSTGPEQALSAVRARLEWPYDLVVTGGARFDFATRGGGVVTALAQAAQEWLCPCIVIAGDVQIGGREMRTMGVEAAYPTGSLSELPAAVARIARSWRF